MKETGTEKKEIPVRKSADSVNDMMDEIMMSTRHKTNKHLVGEKDSFVPYSKPYTDN